MSTRTSGLGGQAGRSPEFESDFAERQNALNAPGSQSWGVNAANTQKSEVPYMVQGADRPGQPNIGQRSIFGNSGPAFTQMPTYTPVTRAPEPQQQAPEPAYAPYPANQPAPQPAPQQRPAQPAPQSHQPQTRQPQQAPAYQPQQPQQPQYQPQAYGGNQHYQPQAPAQSYPQSGYGTGAGTPSQEIPDLSNADPNFPDSIFPDFSNAGASFDEGASDDQGSADASFGDQGDAGFPEPDYQASSDFGYDEAPGHAASDPRFEPAGDDTPDFRMAAPAQDMRHAPQSYQPQAPQQSYAPQGHQPQQGDPRRQLQAFDAVYDQPPQIALGGAQKPAPVPAPEPFYETDRSDADFLDESQALPPAAARSKLASLKGRSAFMVGSALLGAIALGGAMAYAYKQSGGGMGSEQPPIVQADARPVKAAPDDPGGKEFPNKNKLIYDRLTNGDVAEGERIVPRQEDVAVPALPPATDTAGLPAPVATTDLANPATTQAVDTAEDGGPRKVKTLVVRPDGSVEAPAAAEVAEAASAAATAAVDTATNAANAATAAAQGAVMPVPAPQEAPAAQAAAPAPAAAPQVAAVAPAPAPAAPTKYVVQVGAHKSQTDALANYADIQQKNSSLLGKYPPMVQKVAVSGGTMYRLRVGPMDSKSEAYKLCGDLKASGTDCFVATQ
jgi:cell division septation protein DedD